MPSLSSSSAIPHVAAQDATGTAAADAGATADAHTAGGGSGGGASAAGEAHVAEHVGVHGGVHGDAGTLAGTHGGTHGGPHEGHEALAGVVAHAAHAGSGTVDTNPDTNPHHGHSGAGERVTTLAGARGARRESRVRKGRVPGRVGAQRALLWGAPLLAAAALVAVGLWRLAGPAAPQYEAVRSKAHASPVLPRTRTL